jgi:hypothetical protein
MISWLYSTYLKQIKQDEKLIKTMQIDNTVELWGELFSLEGNTLVLANNKENFSLFFDSLLLSIPLNGVLFTKKQGDLKYTEWDQEKLDNILLHQRKLADEDVVSLPFVLIYDNCLDDEYTSSYIESIQEAKKLRLRTVTITTNCKSIPEKVYNNIDTILLFGKKNINKEQLKFLWKKTNKNKISWQDFQKMVIPKFRQCICIKNDLIYTFSLQKKKVIVILDKKNNLQRRK